MEPSQSLPPSSEGAPATTGPDAAGPADPARAAAEAAAGLPAPGVPPAEPRRGIGPLSLDWRTAVVASAAFVLLLAVPFAGTGYRYEPYAAQPVEFSGAAPADARGLQQLTTRLNARQKDLAARLTAAAPRGVYIVIDQTQNRLYLRKEGETLLQAVCSTGSGMVLRESTGKKREWIFDSPRGRFLVRSMNKNPVWAKPDWAFVEESQPIPRNPSERLEYGSLGEYALHFGDGFMIHGTLYERLLGRAVSHGCIRVGRDDLRQVWANAHVGTQIFIY